MISPEERLKVFQAENNIFTKDPLSLVVQFTHFVQDAEDADLAGRVEVWDIQQFLSVNVYEHSLFDEVKRNSVLSDIIGRYNNIVLEAETDPSLRIAFEAR